MDDGPLLWQDPAGCSVTSPPSDPNRPFLARSAWVCALVAALLTLAKLWLMRGQPLFALAKAGYDDRLFLILGDAIRHGRWLGSYTSLTLAKGPGYPLWTAAVSLVHLPLHLAEQILYAFACALLTSALFPIVPGRAGRLLIYLALLWNPMSYEAHVLGRVLRQNLYTPLGMLVFAGLIAIALRPARGVAQRLGWALVAGFSFGGFWLTREESVWIVPSVLLLAALGAYTAWRAGKLRAGALLLGIAAAAAALPVFVVCLLNLHYYGWFGTVEFKAQAFNDAYGSLMRVTSPVEIPFVPVTAQARALIYPQCPAFAELKPILEGPLGRQWADDTAAVTGHPGREMQIAGGWFMWALRDAVVIAGHGPNARSALEYYAELAREVNAACDSGRLPGGPKRSGMFPPWRPGETVAFARVFASDCGYVASFSGFAADPLASEGWDDLLILFGDMTHERMMPSPEAPNFPHTHPWRGDRTKVAILQRVGDILGQVYLVAIIAATALGAIRLITVIARREVAVPVVIAAAAFGGCLASIAVNALVDVTSFPNRSPGSFAQIYPLAILFVAVVAIEAAAVLAAFFRGRKAD